ncbi:hypothetical protein TorRG33x02_011700 [Trema orientale]|uniref:Uncharacterized protein n=1 Tax=Trema orientale TaxID=63057 RepID=A0A2P5FZC4_TREOI|nr:hypothetical protein TorRG33x02_011700 [Trema orientale]
MVIQSSSSILIDEASLVDWHSSAPQSTGFAKLRSWRISVKRRVSPCLSVAHMVAEFLVAMLRGGKELVYFVIDDKEWRDGAGGRWPRASAPWCAGGCA